MPTRVLIADDHAPVRQGLRSFIDPDPEFDVVGEAVDGNDTVRMALELRPDLIVLDNSMPGMTGLEVAEKLRATLPETKIVFLTLDASVRDQALAFGAVAHVSKDQSPDEILRAMRKAAALTSRRAARADRTSAGGESQFAQVLVSANLLSADQMEQIDRGRGAQQTLSNAILHSGLVAEDVLASALARFANSSLVSLATAVTPAVAKQLPRRFCELRACVLIELSRTHATSAPARCGRAPTSPSSRAAARCATPVRGASPPRPPACCWCRATACAPPPTDMPHSPSLKDRPSCSARAPSLSC